MARKNASLGTPGWNEIESLIQSRETVAATAALQRFLKGAQSSVARDERDHRLFLACDGLRRLNLFREGLALVHPLATRPGGARPESTRRARFWTARFLNSLGAGEFALQLLQGFESRGFEEHRIAGNIHLTQFMPERALAYFTAMKAADPDPRCYSSRLARVSLADALHGSGRADEAFAELDAVQAGTNESLLLGILHQARGEYLARAGRIEPARQELAQAFCYFPAQEGTTDFGVLCKWMGYVEELRAPGAGGPYFRKALAHLKQPHSRPEGWLDVYRLMAEAGAVGPEERARLAVYPLASAAFARLLPGHDLRQLPAGRVVGEGRRPRWRVMPDADEYEENAQPGLGIPKELELAALARVADEWGLNREAVKALLWPDEVHSYLQLEDRLKKLMGRCRARLGVKVVYAKGWVRMHGASRARVSVVLGGGDRPRFLRERGEFSSGDLAEHYAVSRAQAGIILRRWLDAGWIEVAGTAPRVRYRSK